MSCIIIALLVCIVIVLINNNRTEHYKDTYAINLQKDSINRMRRWDHNHSSKFSQINGYLPVQNCRI